MKECWINVYWDKYHNERWFGDPRKDRKTAQHVANACLVYRIHVRMKQMPTVLQILNNPARLRYEFKFNQERVAIRLRLTLQLIEDILKR